MLNPEKAFSAFSTNDIQGQGILWKDAGARTFQRPGRHSGCPLSGGTKALMYPKPKPAPTRYSPAGSLNHAIVGPSHEKSYPGQNFHFKSWLSSNCPITIP